MSRRAPSLALRVHRDPSPIDLAAWVEQYARAVLQLEGIAPGALAVASPATEAA